MKESHFLNTVRGDTVGWERYQLIGLVTYAAVNRDGVFEVRITWENGNMTTHHKDTILEISFR